MNPVRTQLSGTAGATPRRTIASYASYDEAERARSRHRDGGRGGSAGPRVSNVGGVEAAAS
jgi:hypothetical protein